MILRMEAHSKHGLRCSPLLVIVLVSLVCIYIITLQKQSRPCIISIVLCEKGV